MIILSGIGGGIRQPVTSGVSLPAGLLDGASFTINGSGFGNQLPNQVLFDNFDGKGQTITPDSTVLSAANCNFNNFGTVNPSARFTNIMTRGSSYCADIFYGGGNHTLQKAGIPSFDDYRISFAWAVPPGYYFPDTGSAYTFPTSSALKNCWITVNGQNGATQNGDDLVPLSWNQRWQTGGNDTLTPNNPALVTGLTVGSPDPSPTGAFSWDVWNKFTIIFRQLGTPGVDSVVIDWYNFTPDYGMWHQQRTYTASRFYSASGRNPAGYGNVAANMWKRGNPAGDSRKILLADYMITTQSNCAARVEIGNASTYDACTDIADCEVTSWVNDAIGGTIRKGGFDLGGSPGSLWIYVHDNTDTEIFSEQIN